MGNFGAFYLIGIAFLLIGSGNLLGEIGFIPVINPLPAIGDILAGFAFILIGATLLESIRSER